MADILGVLLILLMLLALFIFMLKTDPLAEK